MGSSSYTYGNNSPILFIDPDGMENISYLLVVGKVDSETEKIIEAANGFFKQLGLNREMKLAESNGFDASLLDDTDNVIVLGSSAKQVTKYIRENLKGLYDSESSWDILENDGGRVEESSGRVVGVVGERAQEYVDRIERNCLNNMFTMEKYVGFIGVHGTGHNAGALHNEMHHMFGDVGYMMEGKDIHTLLLGGTLKGYGARGSQKRDIEKITGLSDLFNIRLFPNLTAEKLGDYGAGPVTYMLRTFGNESPVDNYHKRKK